MMGLFQDPDLKTLYYGATGSDAYRNGQVTKLLDVVFVIPTASQAPWKRAVAIECL